MSEFKYVIFFITLFIAVPSGYLIAVRSKRVEQLMIFLFVFFSCHMADINFISLESYRGTSKGFELGMIDMIMYILILLIIKRKYKYPIVWLPPGSILYFIYFFFSCISIINAQEPLYSGFEIFKMIRMYIYFWTWYNYCQSQDQINTLLHSFGAIIFYTWCVVMQQKYLNSVFQASGPFPHQNTLVLYMATLGSVAHALMLNRSAARPVIWLILFAMCGFCVIATLSRAGLALFLLNAAIVFSISIFIRTRKNKRLNRRKTIFVIIMPIIGVLAMLKAADSIVERFETAPEESKQTRILLAEAALNMANEKQLGVGLNNFGLVINPPYSYSSHIPMVNEDDPYETHGLVETAYLLIAAETGWHNLAVFVTMLFYFYYLNIKNFFRYKNHELRFLSIAFIGCLSQIYIQSTLEWVLKQTNNFYQIMLIFATIAVMQKLWLREEKYRLKNNSKTTQKPSGQQLFLHELPPSLTEAKDTVTINGSHENSVTAIHSDQAKQRTSRNRPSLRLRTKPPHNHYAFFINTLITGKTLVKQTRSIFFRETDKTTTIRKKKSNKIKNNILLKAASTLLFIVAAAIFFTVCYRLASTSGINFSDLLGITRQLLR